MGSLAVSRATSRHDLPDASRISLSPRRARREDTSAGSKPRSRRLARAVDRSGQLGPRASPAHAAGPGVLVRFTRSGQVHLLRPGSHTMTRDFC